MAIRKVGRGFELRSRKSGKLLGRHATKASALRQERAIQASKRRKKKR